MSGCGPRCGWCGACTEAWERDDEDDRDVSSDGDGLSAPLDEDADARTDAADVERYRQAFRPDGSSVDEP